MKKCKQEKDLDIDLDRYFFEKDPILHKKAIQRLLGMVNVREQFDEILNKEHGVKDFFFMWEDTEKLEKNFIEQQGLRKMSKLSKKYFEQKKI